MFVFGCEYSPGCFKMNGNSHKSHRFVYVEDDPGSRLAMLALFEVMKAQVTIFEESTDFMNQLRALDFVPDIILLDIHMESIDGFSMLDMLRADDVYRDKTVVALTASVMHHQVAALRAAGFDGLIAKPLLAETFPVLIERILNGNEVWHVI